MFPLHHFTQPHNDKVKHFFISTSQFGTIKLDLSTNWTEGGKKHLYVKASLRRGVKEELKGQDKDDLNPS